MTQNSYGEEEETWSTHKTVWAAEEPLSSREMVQGNLEERKDVTRFRIRHQSSITADMRIVSRGKTYEIESVINSYERDREAVLICRRIT